MHHLLMCKDNIYISGQNNKRDVKIRTNLNKLFAKTFSPVRRMNWSFKITQNIKSNPKKQEDNKNVVFVQKRGGSFTKEDQLPVIATPAR